MPSIYPIIQMQNFWLNLKLNHLDYCIYSVKEFI